MDTPHDVPQILFTNLQLLGLDCEAVEKQYRIPCNREMFNLPNKKGFEAVMYFLFNRLNTAKCKELFRDCWPVTDKKQEQQFRKVCNNWLMEISKEEDSHLPRVNPSLLMSPGGDRFYQMLFAFSSYVMLKCITQENGVKSRDVLRRPCIFPQTQPLGAVMIKSIMCSAVTQRAEYMQHLQQAAAVQEQWQVYVSELVKTYRAVNKSVRELERRLKFELQQRPKHQAADSKQSCPNPHKKAADTSGYDQEVDNVRRAQQVQKVRDLWRQVHEVTRASPEREVLESVLQGAAEGQPRIDATDMNIRVPDLLLRQCEREIHRRNVENIYEGGKLNIVSLIHLWNLSLHMYIEQLQQAGVPSFEGDLELVQTQVNTHHAHLANTHALRHKLEKEVIPEVKQSISELTRMLDQRISAHGAALQTSLGFGLMPPTPPVSFDPTDAQTPADVAHANQRTLNTYSESTPEAAEQLVDKLKDKVTHRHVNHVMHATPLYAPRHDHLSQRSKVSGTGVQKHSTKKAKSQIATGTSQRSGAKHSKGSARDGNAKSTASGSRLVKQGGQNHAKHASTVQQVSGKPATHGSKKKRVSPPVHARVERHVTRRDVTAGGGAKADLDHSGLSSIHRSPRDAHDILATQLVDEMMSEGSPREGSGGPAEHNIASMLSTDAFAHKDKLERTPPAQHSRYHNAPLDSSYGPLSSTRMEDKVMRLEKADKDKVATRLFSPQGSEDEEEGIVTISAHDENVHQGHTMGSPDSNPRPGNNQQPTDSWQPASVASFSPNLPHIATMSEQLSFQLNFSEPYSEKNSLHGNYAQGIRSPNGVADSESSPIGQSLGGRQETYGAESESSSNQNPGIQDHYLAITNNRPQKFRLSLDALEARVLKTNTADMNSKELSPLHEQGNGGGLWETEGTDNLELEDVQKNLSIRSNLSETLAELAASATPLLQKRTKSRTWAEKLEKETNGKENEHETNHMVKTTNMQTLSTLSGTGVAVGNLLGGSFSMSPNRSFSPPGTGILDTTPNSAISRSQPIDLLKSPHNGHSPFSSQMTDSVPFQLKLRETPDSKELDSKSKESLDSRSDPMRFDAGLEVEDMIKVIEFQNGTFNEFVETSPARYSESKSKSVSSHNTSKATRKLIESNSAVNTDTDDVIARYRKLRLGKQEHEHSSLETTPLSPSSRQSSSYIGQSNDQSMTSLQSESLYSRLSSMSHISEPSLQGKKFTLNFEDDLVGLPQGNNGRPMGGAGDSMLGGNSLAWVSPSTVRSQTHTESPRGFHGSPLNTSGSPRDLSKLRLNTVPLSPVTSALHAEPLPHSATPTNLHVPAARGRLSMDHIHDIFGEDDSLLVPPSPLMDISS